MITKDLERQFQDLLLYTGKEKKMEERYLLDGTSLRFMVPQELDHHCAEQAREELELMIATYPIRQIIFDFKNTDFMDSSGIGMIMGRYQNLKYRGGSVCAEHLNQRMKRIFLLSGLHKIVKLVEEESVG